MPAPKIVLLSVDEAEHLLPRHPPEGYYLEIERQHESSKWAQRADDNDAKWIVRTICVMKNCVNISHFGQDIAEAFEKKHEYLFILLVGLSVSESAEAYLEIEACLDMQDVLPTLSLDDLIAVMAEIRTPQ